MNSRWTDYYAPFAARTDIKDKFIEQLRAYGIRGSYTLIINGLESDILFGFKFTDPKDQFIFELHGGNAHFSRLIMKATKDYLIHEKKW
jgi:hypothetical protein